MAKSPNWSIEEINLLKINYPILGKCQELQDLFPSRPLQGICLKANRIGLKVINMKGIDILKLEKNILKSSKFIKYFIDRKFDGSTELADINTPILEILEEYYE